MNRPPWHLATAVLALCAILTPATAVAHDLTITEAVMVVRADGRVVVEMICDLDALALGAPANADDGELYATLTALDPDDLAARRDTLRQLLTRRVKIRADGGVLPSLVALPDEGRYRRRDSDRGSLESPESPESPKSLAAIPSHFGTTARFEAKFPDDANELTFMASRAFPPVHLTILDQRNLSGRREILLQGARSTPYRLDTDPNMDSMNARGCGGQFGRYLVLGFEHILPRGLDHVLFVLGLFLFGLAWRPLLLQVTAFTVAHTLTLGLASAGIVALDPGLVEPLIALSIAWIAVENLLVRDQKPRRILPRLAVVFGFGLLHGLGFAGVLGDLGLPQSAFVSALLGFNIGVELGQLAVIALAFLVVGWARDRPWFQQRIAWPASLAIALIGLWWFVERVFLA